MIKIYRASWGKWDRFRVWARSLLRRSRGEYCLGIKDDERSLVGAGVRDSGQKKNQNKSPPRSRSESRTSWLSETELSGGLCFMSVWVTLCKTV